ncbi:MAG: carbamoyltransferase HypF [Thermoplasmata archaeon]
MRIILKGIVQGVGFRPTVYRVAKNLGMNGYVKNMGSEVEVVIDGDVDEFLSELKRALPPLAKLTSVDVFESGGTYDDFSIISSTDGDRSSSIPVDTATCKNCVAELEDRKNRRFTYPFINCTDCGARYSAIRELPYDREKTTMAPFHMCPSCREEYGEPMDRRFHAQTLSCPDCGPGYTLYDKNKKRIGGVVEFISMIEEGSVGVAKSWGGMHIVSTLDRIPELRRRYGRSQKPFAIMVKDLETARKYAHITREDVFTGPRRPIMIYEKKEPLEKVAPGLPTVGMMLPYTPLHHILFDGISEDALVMTSANLPGEPMIIKNRDAFSLDLDCYLLHDRKIANRIDDSLIRVHGDELCPIRRSRGYVPETLPFDKSTVFAAGADQGGCLAFSTNAHLYPSQYLGDLGSYGAKVFYQNTVEHLESMLGIQEVEAVAVDLHPAYTSRKLGLEYAKNKDIPVVEVQHHWAHGASLLLEHDLEHIVCIAVDGTGYGEDGGSWGGEVLYCTADEYERTAHLEPFPLLGGEQAVKYPKRLAHAIHRKLGHDSPYFDDKTASILDKLMDKSVNTTSFGRLLDAVSAALGACTGRTYEGEPAMKLEKLQLEGENTREYTVYRKGDTIHTLKGFVEMLKDRSPDADRAASYAAQVSYALSDAAADAAEKYGAPVGISGGVSYNRHIVDQVRSRLKERGYQLLVHQRVPNGDMGVCVGQASIAASM